MSAKSAREFLERIANDDQFRETVSNELKDQTEPAVVIMSVASKSGYSFTASEISEVLKVFNHEGKEMTEAELQAVAGGVTLQSDATIFRTLQLVYQPRPTFTSTARAGIDPQPF